MVAHKLPYLEFLEMTQSVQVTVQLVQMVQLVHPALEGLTKWSIVLGIKENIRVMRSCMHLDRGLSVEEEGFFHVVLTEVGASANQI